MKKLLNEELKKLIREAEEDDPEFLDVSDEPVELGITDTSKQITKQVSDDNWDVFIPRTQDMLRALSFSDDADIQPSAAIYIFKNKHDGPDYMFIPRHHIFGELKQNTNRWSRGDWRGDNFVNFITTQTSERIQDWAMKKFPNTYGKKIRTQRLVSRASTNLNHVYTYPENEPILKEIDDNGGWRARGNLVKQITKIVVSEGTEQIGWSAFSNFGVSDDGRNKVEVILPKSLKTIHANAFSYCGVEEIVLPDGITHIGDRVFSGSSLKTINMPDSIQHIGESCFNGCSMTKFIFPKNINRIPYAYYAGNNVSTGDRRNFVIPSWVVAIDSRAFQDVHNTNIYIPKSVNFIEKDAFYRTTECNFYCEREELPENWKSSVFSYPGTNTIVWGGYNPAEKIVEDITNNYIKEDDAEDDELNGFEVSDEPIELGVYTKDDIVKHAKRILSDKEWEIWKPKSDVGMQLLASGTRWLAGKYCVGSNAKDAPYDTVDENSRVLRNWQKMYVILNKTKLNKKFLFEAGYGQIYSPSGAYYSCSSWVIKQNSEKLLKWFADGNFPWVSNRLKPIANAKKVAASGNVYHYPQDGELPWNVKRDIDSIIIEPGTTRIARSGLAGFRKVTEIQIPDTVKIISSYAFSACENLKQLILPAGLTTIGASAFYEMKIESLIIPSSVKKIGDQAFYGCGQLKKIFIPKSVTTVGSSLFAGWTSEAVPITVYCEAESQPIGWNERWTHVSNRYDSRTQNYDTPYRKIKVVWGATGLPE